MGRAVLPLGSAGDSRGDAAVGNSQAHDQHRTVGKYMQRFFEFLAPYLPQPPVLRVGGFPVGKTDHGHAATESFPGVNEAAGPQNFIIRMRTDYQ